MNPIVKDDLLEGIKSGDIWLNKVKYDNEGKRIRGNVCLEVYLPSRGTCLLQHVNLGACEFGQISTAFVVVCPSCAISMARQVLARLESISTLPSTAKSDLGFSDSLIFSDELEYLPETFGLALDDYINGTGAAPGAAYELVKQIDEGIRASAAIARQNKMDRAFAIAPTASCSYRSKDLDGFTCTPEIAPPIARTVDRDSGTFGVRNLQLWRSRDRQ